MWWQEGNIWNVCSPLNTSNHKKTELSKSKQHICKQKMMPTLQKYLWERERKGHNLFHLSLICKQTADRDFNGSHHQQIISTRPRSQKRQPPHQLSTSKPSLAPWITAFLLQLSSTQQTPLCEHPKSQREPSGFPLRSFVPRRVTFTA